MSTRRLVPLLLAVAGLLAIAALAAHGHPLTGSRGAGPTASFFDYVFTSVAAVAVVIGVLFLYGLLGTKPATPAIQRQRFSFLQLLGLFAVATLIALVLSHGRLHIQIPTTHGGARHGKQTHGQGTIPPRARARGARLRWDEIAIVAALFAAAGVAAFAMRSRPSMKEWRFRPHEEAALALDESLDDLRSEPDLRRAIIAAYARMELALAGAGIPRRPSEAPHEYLARALTELDTSAPAVTRLTDLFERAKFSQHDPDESMRHDAIAALEAVRDDLRRPAAAA